MGAFQDGGAGLVAWAEGGDVRSQVLAIAQHHGAYNVRVFGSVARGESTAASDIDFVVDYDLERISSWFPVGLIHDLEDFLQCRVDVVLANSLHPLVRQQVDREAIQL
ncbi:nucleotidyltransferase family protein [Prochlorothrix hollandica]|uniref:DNA polymerase subunit beta n=1 Tax=Prochlorothrix hollandica PCC 9006 = CALU 1027 TaxID=317619 RepID=A0A0M2Q0Q2_PROHO|nr:DNA polymerase subunit beta [Prochlorothrix hollandica PCC 9006 = CALU 1027]